MTSKHWDEALKRARSVIEESPQRGDSEKWFAEFVVEQQMSAIDHAVNCNPTQVARQLTIVQARCTELLEEARSLKAEIAMMMCGVTARLVRPPGADGCGDSHDFQRGIGRSWRQCTMCHATECPKCMRVEALNFLGPDCLGCDRCMGSGRRAGMGPMPCSTCGNTGGQTFNSGFCSLCPPSPPLSKAYHCCSRNCLRGSSAGDRATALADPRSFSATGCECTCQACNTVRATAGAKTEKARLDPEGTAKGKTVLTAPVVGDNDGVVFSGPASTHVDTETGKRTPLAVHELIAAAEMRGRIDGLRWASRVDTRLTTNPREVCKYEADRLECEILAARIDPTATMSSAPIKDPAHALRFLLAGNAHATFVSLATGTRFTYKVALADRRPGDTKAPPHFVAVLTGPDNYQYLGVIYGSKIFTHGRKSRVSQDAPSALAFAWVWQRLTAGRVPESVEVWHEGRCARCGRRLSVPTSIETGLGPECEKKMVGGVA